MMPCCYMFALCMYLKMAVFTEDMVATRWLMSYQTSVVTDDSSYNDSHLPMLVMVNSDYHAKLVIVYISQCWPWSIQTTKVSHCNRLTFQITKVSHCNRLTFQTTKVSHCIH